MVAAEQVKKARSVPTESHSEWRSDTPLEELLWLHGTPEADATIPRVDFARFDEDKDMLIDRLVFVGFRDPHDLRSTPVGVRYGVEILALAADYIVQGASIRSTLNWFNILGIVTFCGFVSISINAGRPGGSTLLWCVATFALFVIIGAVSMVTSRVWVDMFLIPMCALISCLFEILVRWVDATPHA